MFKGCKLKSAAFVDKIESYIHMYIKVKTTGLNRYLKLMKFMKPD